MTLAKYYYLNETGSKKNQEDFIWPSPRAVGKDSKIFIVCDGVGGASKGEVASRLVAEYMGNALSKTDIATLSIERINNLLGEARTVLSEYARTEQAGKDMATTFTLLALHTEKAFIAWCGDSRVYHFRAGKILYKTDDHSLVNSLVKTGEISEADAMTHPQKNVILKAIKADSTLIEAEGGWSSQIEEGDYFLLCTDGLLENWRDDALADLLSSPHEDNENLADLFQKRSFNRTRDNYSMYLVQIKKDPEHHKSPKKNKVATGFFLFALLALVVASTVYFTSQRKNDRGINTKIKGLPGSIDTQPLQKPPMVVIEDSGAVKEQPSKDTVLTPVHVQIINPAGKDSIHKHKQPITVEKIVRKKTAKDSIAGPPLIEPVPLKQKEDSTQDKF